jgi:hypothetical protein
VQLKALRPDLGQDFAHSVTAQAEAFDRGWCAAQATIDRS